VGTKCACAPPVRQRWREKEGFRESVFPTGCKAIKNFKKPCWVLLSATSLTASFQWSSVLALHGEGFSAKSSNISNAHIDPVVLYQCAPAEGLVLLCS